MGMPHVENPKDANTLYIEKDEVPGVCVLSGGDTNYAISTSQEDRSFVTRLFFSGFTPPSWRATFTIWTNEQYKAAVALKKKYCPQPRKAFPTPVTLANSYLREQDIQACIITSWTPMTAPTPGMAYTFYFRFVQAFPVGFRPDKSKSNKNKQKPVDVEQRTDRAINPEADIDSQYNNVRTPPVNPADAYKEGV